VSTKGTQEHDLWLGRKALAKGLITGPQLTEGLLLQSKTGLRKSLDQVLADQGWVAAEALAVLREELVGQPTQKRLVMHVDNDAESRVGKIFLRVLCDSLLDQQPFLTSYVGRLPRDSQPVCLHLITKVALRHGLWLDFLETVRSAQGLSDANLVEVLDVDTLDDHFAIVTRHSKGALSLASLIERVRRLKLSEAMRISRELAQALAALHAAGICHRDVRPERVILSPDGGVRLTLPGVTFSPEGAESFGVKSMIFGSPHFIAPECLKGWAQEAKSDVYALGVIAYELVTGVRPFEGEGLKDLGPQHLDSPVIPPHKIITALPQPVGELLAWMLAKSTAKRPSAAQAVDAFREAEGGVQRSGLTQKFQAFNPEE
jgi:serine/threonine protein kinase